MRTAHVDRHGIRGPSGGIEGTIDAERTSWPFEARFDNFRLLDPLSRVTAIAVETLGCEFAEDAAIVLATTQGCLWADREFERSRAGDLRPGLFPYTLPSAAIAAIAIRHGIRGPTLCLSGPPEQAFEEAERLIEAGEAPAVLLCTGDVVPPDTLSMTARYLTR
jgi:3-oxoacyl-(acyl-carrier-protein) synthase